MKKMIVIFSLILLFALVACDVGVVDQLESSDSGKADYIALTMAQYQSIGYSVDPLIEDGEYLYFDAIHRDNILGQLGSSRGSIECWTRCVEERITSAKCYCTKTVCYVSCRYI